MSQPHFPIEIPPGVSYAQCLRATWHLPADVVSMDCPGHKASEFKDHEGLCVIRRVTWLLVWKRVRRIYVDFTLQMHDIPKGVFTFLVLPGSCLLLFLLGSFWLSDQQICQSGLTRCLEMFNSSGNPASEIPFLWRSNSRQHFSYFN